MNEESINDHLEKSILTKKRFTKLIEDKVLETKMDYITAVIDVCDDFDLDPMDVSNLISPIIKDKIEAEAIKLRLIKGGNQLPL
jgi:hypothetical protein